MCIKLPDISQSRGCLYHKMLSEQSVCVSAVADLHENIWTSGMIFLVQFMTVHMPFTDEGILQFHTIVLNLFLHANTVLQSIPQLLVHVSVKCK